MQRFNARLDINGYQFLDNPGEYQIDASITDNTGIFNALDASINNLIFINGQELGNPLLMEFEVFEVIDNSNPPNVILNVRYINPINYGPYDPIGNEGVIGSQSPNGIIQIPEATTQNLSQNFVNSLRNFQIDVEQQSNINDSIIISETLVTDGITNTFIPINIIKSNLVIFFNGLRLSNDDYTLIDNIITLSIIPTNLDTLTIEYIKK